MAARQLRAHTSWFRQAPARVGNTARMGNRNPRRPHPHTPEDSWTHSLYNGSVTYVEEVVERVNSVTIENANIHIERLETGAWWMSITHEDGSMDLVHFMTKRGAFIDCILEENVG